MAEIIVLPAPIAADCCKRVAADLSAAMTRGEDLGSRKAHIIQIDRVMERLLSTLEAELSRLPGDDPVTCAFRAKVEEFVVLTGEVQRMARMLARTA